MVIKDRKKTLALISAFLIAAASLSGCGDQSSEDGGESKNADAAGGKAVTVYLDENGTPYYYDNEGNQMMIWSSEYEVYAEGDDGEDIQDEGTDSYVYEHYDKNGLVFDIPDGWLVDDSYIAPTVMKDPGENFDDIDYERTISLVPTQLMFSDADDGTKIDKSYLKSYYDSMVSSGMYSKYKIVSESDGTIGSESAKIYDVSFTATYLDLDGSSFDETARVIYYVSQGDVPFLAILNCPDSDDDVKEIVGAYDSFKDSIQIPSKEQADAIIEEYNSAFEGFDEEDFGDDIDNVEFDDE